jgi:DNA repair protein RadC
MRKQRGGIRKKHFKAGAEFIEATAIIMVHNHPGRKPKPSAEDIASTKRVAEAAEKVDVQLLDHIIIAGDDYFSMRERKRAIFPLMRRLD